MVRRIVLLIVLTAGLAPRSAAQENSRLRADALRTLGCLAQGSAPIRLNPQDSGATGFSVQYVYETQRFEIGNGKYESQQDLALLVHGKDGRTAYVFKVWMSVPETPGRIELWNALYLEKPKQQWQIIELWQGGESVYAKQQRSLKAILATPLRTIPRSAVPTPTGPCWVSDPQVGGYGMRLGSSGTAFQGVRIQSQSGPYNNSLGGGAPPTVWLTFYEDGR